MFDWDKRNSLPKGTFPAHNPFEQPQRDVAAWAERRHRQAGQWLLSCPGDPALLWTTQSMPSPGFL